MRVEILSLFPEFFSGFLSSSIVARAIESKAIDVRITDFRAYSQNKHRKVDDYPYGGFAGMVIQAQPLYDAINDLLEESFAPVVYFSPQGRVLDQSILGYYASLPRVILLCGHYKEIDQRVRNIAVCDEISLGDYVLSGGEIAALAFVDGVARLQEGVLGDINSAQSDSFSDQLLGFPCYSRPETFMEQSVPEVLRNGNHKLISDWAKEQSIKLTRTRRPDLTIKK
ncbi:MAG: tRNA (guanosine(37)-N1)-methyltransferase TrmD [Candidatus Cloacimonadaceae bacterium]|nr:tRNA (guanosine(37)-N1)-methyltransferase TrmD [Candidatus Cloacimonadaceae bacterium]MDP3114270.1 tRNA (guanosine(37)-N1)-methyltransferase TrmD [Candidatus Cloacimonadaceae bacterium]